MSGEYVVLGNQTILKQLLAGPYIFLDTRDNVNVAIGLHGLWEPWVTKQFMTVVKPGMTVLDIGAHCGYFSLLAGRLVGFHGKVYSFEPNPYYHYNFLRSMALNAYSHVTLHKVALAKEKGEMEIIQCSEDGGDGPSISPFGAFLEHPNHQITVDTGNLLDYLPSLKVDVIKIDVDGGEPFIMDSIIEIVKHNPKIKIFMEYLPSIWGGHDPYPFLKKLADQGMFFQILQWDGNVVNTSVEYLANYRDPIMHLDLFLERK